MFKRIFATLLACFLLLNSTTLTFAEPALTNTEPIPVEMTAPPGTVPEDSLSQPSNSGISSTPAALEGSSEESVPSDSITSSQLTSEPVSSETTVSESGSSQTYSPHLNSSRAVSRPVSSAPPPEPNNSQWSENLAVTLSLACDWVRNSEKGSLYFLCMGSAGKPAVSRTVNQYITDVSLKTEYEEAADLAYDILNVTFCGYSAENVLGKNLLDQLSIYPDFEQKDIYTIAYSLLAIDSNQYEISQIMKNNRENLKSSLLTYQGESGGFFSRYSSDGENVSQTALAVSALAPYREEPEISAAIERALNFLIEQQVPEGGYYENGDISSVAISRTIIALNCLEIPMSDPRFVRNQKTLLSILLDYVNLDSGFAEHIGEDSDVYATERAILALTSVKKQGSPYQLENLLANVFTETPENTVIEEETEQQTNWISGSICLLLGALIVFLVATLVLFKIHPIKRSQYYQKHHPDQQKPDHYEITEQEQTSSEDLDSTGHSEPK